MSRDELELLLDQLMTEQAFALLAGDLRTYADRREEVRLLRLEIESTYGRG